MIQLVSVAVLFGLLFYMQRERHHDETMVARGEALKATNDGAEGLKWAVLSLRG